MEHRESPIANHELLTRRFDISISTKASEAHPDSNEDNSFAKEKRLGVVTFGVFDGMGGEVNGRDSSSFCSAAVESGLSGIDSRMSTNDVKQKLRRTSKDVNTEFINKKEKLKLGGSTGVFGVILPDKNGDHTAVIANIGDSRAYIFRDGQLIKLTTDDSKLRIDYPREYPRMQERLDEATNRYQLTNEELAAFKSRNTISGFFGNHRAEPETITFTLRRGDVVLVTTDGIHDNLTSTEIKNILNLQKNNDASTISTSIVSSSVSRSQEGSFRSKVDDMTALVIKFEEDTLPPQSLPERFVPRINQPVNVQRSSGIVESGWVIYSINDDEIVVHKKEENGNIVIKRLEFSDLDRFNRLPKPSDIASSENFSQLFFTLNQLGGIQGSEVYYSKDYLITTIGKYLKGEVDIKNLTRSEGLRDIVQTLFNKKSSKQT